MATRTFRFQLFPAAVLVLAASLAACDPKPTPTSPLTAADSLVLAGRLTARPIARTLNVPLGLTDQTVTVNGRQFGLYVPSNYDPSKLWPVTVLLHGAGDSGEQIAIDFKDFAETAGVVVLAPNSFATTWDLIINDQFGIDVEFIDNMLKWGFDHIAVDPARLSISGFSDGATYAVWLGLKNGDLFSRIAAFTPCTEPPLVRTGMPTLFVSQGTDDTVLPAAACSRLMVPDLQAEGYTVQYVEYPSATTPPSNGHFVTPDVITQGMTYLAHQ